MVTSLESLHMRQITKMNLDLILIIKTHMGAKERQKEIYQIHPGKIYNTKAILMSVLPVTTYTYL